MDFLSKLLHRNPSGGGGSPQKPLSSKASDTLGQIKSETNFSNKGQQDVILSANLQQTAQLSENDQHKKTDTAVSEKLHNDEEEDEKFEDAQENKLSLTLLAENLDNIHLSTPGKIIFSNSEHEFASNKHFRSDLSNSSYENCEDSEISFGLNTNENCEDSEISFGQYSSMTRSLSPEVNDGHIQDHKTNMKNEHSACSESNKEPDKIDKDCSFTTHSSSDCSHVLSGENPELSIATEEPIKTELDALDQLNQSTHIIELSNTEHLHDTTDLSKISNSESLHNLSEQTDKSDVLSDLSNTKVLHDFSDPQKATSDSTEPIKVELINISSDKLKQSIDLIEHSNAEQLDDTSPYHSTNSNNLPILSNSECLNNSTEQTIKADIVSDSSNAESLHDLLHQKMIINDSTEPKEIDILYNTSDKVNKSIDPSELSSVEQLENASHQHIAEETLNAGTVCITSNTEVSHYLPDLTINNYIEPKEEEHNMSDQLNQLIHLTIHTNTEQLHNTSDLYSTATKDLTLPFNSECLRNLSEQTVKSDISSDISNADDLHNQSDQKIVISDSKEQIDVDLLHTSIIQSRQSTDVTEQPNAEQLEGTSDYYLTQTNNLMSNFESLNNLSGQTTKPDVEINSSSTEILHELPDEKVIVNDTNESIAMEFLDNSSDQLKQSTNLTGQSNAELLEETSDRSKCLNNLSEHAAKSDCISDPSNVKVMHDLQNQNIPMSDSIEPTKEEALHDTSDQLNQSKHTVELSNTEQLHDTSDSKQSNSEIVQDLSEAMGKSDILSDLSNAEVLDDISDPKKVTSDFTELKDLKQSVDLLEQSNAELLHDKSDINSTNSNDLSILSISECLNNLPEQTIDADVLNNPSNAEALHVIQDEKIKFNNPNEMINVQDSFNESKQCDLIEQSNAEQLENATDSQAITTNDCTIQSNCIFEHNKSDIINDSSNAESLHGLTDIKITLNNTTEPINDEPLLNASDQLKQSNFLLEKSTSEQLGDKSDQYSISTNDFTTPSNSECLNNSSGQTTKSDIEINSSITEILHEMTDEKVIVNDTNKSITMEFLNNSSDQSKQSTDLTGQSNAELLEETSDLSECLNNVSEHAAKSDGINDSSNANLLHDLSTGQSNAELLEETSDLSKCLNNVSEHAVKSDGINDSSNAKVLHDLESQNIPMSDSIEPTKEEVLHNTSDQLNQSEHTNELSNTEQLNGTSDTKLSNSESLHDLSEEMGKSAGLSECSNAEVLHDISVPKKVTSDFTEPKYLKQSIDLPEQSNAEQLHEKLDNHSMNSNELSFPSNSKCLNNLTEQTIHSDVKGNPSIVDGLHDDQKIITNNSAEPIELEHNTSDQLKQCINLTMESNDSTEPTKDVPHNAPDLKQSSDLIAQSQAEQLPNLSEETLKSDVFIDSSNAVLLHNISEQKLKFNEFDQQSIDLSVQSNVDQINAVHTNDLIKPLTSEYSNNLSHKTMEPNVHSSTSTSNSEFSQSLLEQTMKSPILGDSSSAEVLHDVCDQASTATVNDAVSLTNADKLHSLSDQSVNSNDSTKPPKADIVHNTSHQSKASSKDLCKPANADVPFDKFDLTETSRGEQFNDVHYQTNNTSGLIHSPTRNNSHFMLDESNNSSNLSEVIDSNTRSVNEDKGKRIMETNKESPKTTKCVKGKIPKRSLNKSYQFENPKSNFNSEGNTMCEFFITSEKKSEAAIVNDVDEKLAEEATIPSDFDERLAEEAANLSEHLHNLSQQMQDSDSETECNKTVISASNEILNSSPQKPRASGLYQCKEPQRSIEIGNEFSCHEAYMQSMHSVLPAHLNQSEAGPITADELSTQDLEFQDGASLDLDYFNQVGSKEEQLRLSLTRDSLYVKFDPIVNAIVSKTVNNKFKMPPPHVPDQEKTSEEQNESKSSDTKSEEPDNSPKTPGKSPALEAVQKLISLTPPPASAASVSPAKSIFENVYWSWCPYERSTVGTPTSVPPKSAFISPEQLKKELTKLENIMREREKYFEIELDKRLSELEERDSEIKRRTTRQAELEAEVKVVAEREHRLKKEVVERTKSKQQLSLVMEEYEKTISQLVAQKEEDKKEFEAQKDLLMQERDTAMQHLNNMEIAFNDVHQKYERSKTVIEGMKANEDSLKKSLTEYDDAIRTSNAKYESLKNHAIKQLETANLELDSIRRSHQAEIAKLKAMLKKAEVRVTSLEESLEQKSKENQELAAICDELISKVGSTGN